jgi:hypothetical protein
MGVYPMKEGLCICLGVCKLTLIALHVELIKWVK